MNNEHFPSARSPSPFIRPFSRHTNMAQTIEYGIRPNSATKSGRVADRASSFNGNTDHLNVISIRDIRY